MTDQVPSDFYTSGEYFVRRPPVTKGQDPDRPATIVPVEPGVSMPPLDMKKPVQIPYVIRPPWLDPPLAAIMVDLRTDPGIALPAGSSNVALIQFEVPDRYFGVFWKFGQGLSNPAFFGTVQWTLAISNAPNPFLNRFTQQVGEYVRPTRFEAPIKAIYKSLVQVFASNPGAAPVTAFARLMGWIFPVTDETIWDFTSI